MTPDQMKKKAEPAPGGQPRQIGASFETSVASTKYERNLERDFGSELDQQHNNLRNVEHKLTFKPNYHKDQEQPPSYQIAMANDDAKKEKKEHAPAFMCSVTTGGGGWQPVWILMYLIVAAVTAVLIIYFIYHGRKID
jgi:hypothetical protein